MSRAWVEGQREKFLENFSSVFRQIFFLIIPVSFLVFLLRAQLVRLILGTGQFGWQDTRLTAACLGLFCFGIFAFSTVPFLSRVFYSFQDTKTPVIVSLVTIGLNVSLCFLFVWLLSFDNFFHSFIVDNLKLYGIGIGAIGVVGLPLALAISGVIRFCLLLFFLRKKMGHIRLREIKNSFEKIFLASLLMAIVVYFSLQFLATLVDMQTFVGLLVQVISASLIGAFVYLFSTYLLKSPEIKTIKSSILKQFVK